jgi:hypothetical protein
VCEAPLKNGRKKPRSIRELQSACVAYYEALLTSPTDLETVSFAKTWTWALSFSFLASNDGGLQATPGLAGPGTPAPSRNCINVRRESHKLSHSRAKIFRDAQRFPPAERKFWGSASVAGRELKMQHQRSGGPANGGNVTFWNEIRSIAVNFIDNRGESLL